MSVQSEAAELAAKAAAKGALNLIRWGKKIIPATADEIEKFGPNAARVKGLLNMVDDVSEDAGKLSAKAYGPTQREIIYPIEKVAYNSGRYREQDQVWDSIMSNQQKGTLLRRMQTNGPAQVAARAEVVSDLITPETYVTLTNPFAVARRFDRTVSNSPESFTNIARSLGERGLISAPKDVELARRVSMLPPAMQQVYLDLVGEGTDLAQLLQALRLMGQ